MGSYYRYDSTGVNFSFFTMTIMIILSISSTLYLSKLQSKAAPYQLINCKCETCNNYKKWKPKSWSFNYKIIKSTIMGLIWLICFLTIYYAWSNKDKMEKPRFDPYEILGINEKDSLKIIRKAYRDLSLKYHPDRVKKEKREESEKKFVEVTKAYKILTNSEARKDYERTGNPDGVHYQGSVGMALPSWIVDKGNYWLLIIYVLSFCIIIPLIVWKKWKERMSLTKFNASFSTMDFLYLKLNNETSLKELIELIALTSEFDHMPKCSKFEIMELESKVKTRMNLASIEPISQSSTLNNQNYYTLLSIWAHLLRIEPVPKRPNIVKILKPILYGLIMIGSERKYNNLTLKLINLNRMLIQGIPSLKMAYLQIPGFSFGMACKLAKANNSYTFENFIFLSPNEKLEYFQKLKFTKNEISKILIQDIPPKLKVFDYRVDDLNYIDIADTSVSFKIGLISNSKKTISSINFPILFTDPTDKFTHYIHSPLSNQLETIYWWLRVNFFQKDISNQKDNSSEPIYTQYQFIERVPIIEDENNSPSIYHNLTIKVPKEIQFSKVSISIIGCNYYGFDFCSNY